MGKMYECGACGAARYSRKTVSAVDLSGRMEYYLSLYDAYCVEDT